MPISPPANPRLGQVYQEAGTTYVWIGSTWVETIPSTSPPFPSANNLGAFAIGPTGPAGTFGATGPSGGPIGPTGYTGTTGPLPDFSIAIGPDNGLLGSIVFSTGTSYGRMNTTNNSTNFTSAFNRLSIGDTYTARVGGGTTIQTFTLASIPTILNNSSEWTTYENDPGLVGNYGLIYLNSLQGKPGPTGPAGIGLANGGNSIISSNLIPATGNVYSIGDSTHWWKDMWLSANTLYVGGVPISTAGGQLSVNSLSVNPNTTYNQDSASEIFYSITGGVAKMQVNNPNADFVKNIQKVNIGEQFTATYSDPVTGVLSKKTLTFKGQPYWGASNQIALFWLWEVVENDGNLVGEYASISLDSLKVLLVGTTPITPIGGGISVPGVNIPPTYKNYGPYSNTSVELRNDGIYWWADNASPEFITALDLLKIGDKFQVTPNVNVLSNGHSVSYTYTISVPPRDSYVQYRYLNKRYWETVENLVALDMSGRNNYNYDYLSLLVPGALTIGNTPISSINGSIVIPNLNVSGLLTSNLVPAVGNTYSLGSSTSWFKDIWISANTFYVGGKPISVTANGQISIGDLVVTGSINGAAVNNVLNPVSGEPLITYNYTFDATLTDWNVYSGNRSVPDGKFIILGVGWPERPGVSLFGSNGTSGGYVNYMKMSGKTSDGKDIYQELKDKFAAAQSPNPRYTFIRLSEAGNPGNYSVFYWGGSLTSHDSSRTFEFAVTYIAGTASSDVWTSSNIQIIVEFSQKTMHGRIPLMDAQKYWWTKPHFFGPGFDMTVPYCAPLCCSGLWLYPPASNTGTVNFPTGNVWVGKSVTVWVFGNSLAKSNLVNVRTTSLPTTITANSFFNITYLDNNLKWAVTYQGTI